MKGLLIFLAVLISLINSSLLYAEQSVGGSKILRTGFSPRVVPEVDQRDAKIAMELWTRELARGIGIKTTPQTVIFKNSGELIDSVKRGEMTVVTLTILEYLQIRDKAPMTPIIVSSSGADKGRQFVLIARKDSGIKSVADLRGRSIMMLSEKKFETSRIWLDVLLMRAGYRGSIQFFSQTRESSSAQAIMGVFFKQSDAALVSFKALEISKTLNPQISSQLMIIAESNHLHGNVTCVPTMVDEQLKKVIEKTSLHLHETMAGKQIFTLFQADRVLPFTSAYLGGVEALLRDRDRLLAKQGKRK